MKKTIALILACCLMVGLLAGCGSTEIRSYSDEDTAAETRDMSLIYSKYEPDTVVMTVGGEKVTWSEFFYWLNACVTSADSSNGSPVTDWSTEVSEGMTMSQSAVEAILVYIVQYHALNQNAKKLGISLTEDDSAALQANLQADIATYCGDEGTEEEFNAYLETLFMTRDYYDYINSTSTLYSSMFTQTQGENGEKISDEEAMSYAEENGYMAAKHILFSTLDSEGASLSDEEIAEKLSQAQAAADELQAISDPTARQTRLDELSAEYNEDTGSSLYPNGYCFTDGEMVTEFQSAVEGLEDYEVSEPVQTQYGYHVIMRLPVTADSEVSYVSEGVYRTMRYYAAADIYSTLVSTWIDETETVWEDEFANLDIGKLLEA